MVAGATGIDLFLLVIDAAEGARPQTHEHLAILRLLGIEHGVVARDEGGRCRRRDPARWRWRRRASWCRAPRSWRRARRQAQGLDELREALAEVADRVERRRPREATRRLFVDRVFSSAGSGRSSPGRSGRLGRRGRRAARRARGLDAARPERPGARPAGGAGGGGPARRRRAPGSGARRAPTRGRAGRAPAPFRSAIAWTFSSRAGAVRRRPAPARPPRDRRALRRGSCASARATPSSGSLPPQSRRAATGSSCARAPRSAAGSSSTRPRPGTPPPSAGSSAATRAIVLAVGGTSPCGRRARTPRACSAELEGACRPRAGGRLVPLARAARASSRPSSRRRIAAGSPLDPGLLAGPPRRPWAPALLPLLPWSDGERRLYAPGATAQLGARAAAAERLEAELAAAGFEPVKADDPELARYLEERGRLVRLGDGLALGAEAFAEARRLLVRECEAAGLDHARPLPRPARHGPQAGAAPARALRRRRAHAAGRGRAGAAAGARARTARRGRAARRRDAASRAAPCGGSRRRRPRPSRSRRRARAGP